MPRSRLAAILCTLAVACTTSRAEPLPGPAVVDELGGATERSATERNATERSATELAEPTAIQWLGFDEGLVRARVEGKPVVAVFTATWCPHCTRYAERVLVDPAVIRASRDFVMVRVDVDASPEVANRYKPDGGYVPRTLFFSPGGELAASIQGSNPRFRHFLDTQAPTELLGLMERARALR